LEKVKSQRLWDRHWGSLSLLHHLRSKTDLGSRLWKLLDMGNCSVLAPWMVQQKAGWKNSKHFLWSEVDAQRSQTPACSKMETVVSEATSQRSLVAEQHSIVSLTD